VPDGTPGAAALPAGRYAVLLHVGPFRGLAAAREALLAWGEGIEWDPRVALERYLTNPREEADSSKWQTELAYLVK
jgi:effector-binding domain-containing protein